MARIALVGVLLAILCWAAPVAADPDATGVRLAGPDRIATAIVVSQNTFPTQGSAHSVLLAREDDFADALAGTPLAVQAFGPMLLTHSAQLDGNVETEITRVLPKGDTVYLLGGTLALSDAVATQVKNDGYTPTRIAGPDRFATAVAIAKTITSPQAILLATGDTAGDALTAGAAAAQAQGVVLLTDDSRMPQATQDYMSANGKLPVFAIGGPAAAADSAATSISGADRYETSVKVAQQFFGTPPPNNLGFANGFAYPDALSGGAAIGQDHGPLLLIAPDDLPDVVHHYVVTVSPTVHLGEVYGGTLVVPDGVLAAIDSAMKGN